MADQPTADQPRVLFATAELYPWVKTGGLADVSAALPPAVARLGVDIRFLLPGLPAFRDALTHAETVADLGSAFGAPRVSLIRGVLPDTGLTAYLVDAPALFDRPGNPYIDDTGHDYSDNHRRFALFGWVAARLVDDGWAPDVVHAHDWHAGLAPAWIATIGGARPASLFTIHNLAYQGFVPGPLVPELGLPARFFNVEGIEYHGGASFMKAGLYFADRLTTVSPTYAMEIQQSTNGMGLHGLLADRAADLQGIVNGVDNAVWNPATDGCLAANYDSDTLSAKAGNKAALQRELALTETADAALLCVVSRLTEQKGMDFVIEALPEILEAGAQLAILGSGDHRIEAAMRQHAEQYPGQMSVTIGYDETLSHRLIGSADMILVPSRYEPCGLTQLYGLRYATLPIVTPVGGLADTVDADTGFVSRACSGRALAATIARALAVYHQPDDWHDMCCAAMTRDFSWDRSAARYADLYTELATLSTPA